MNLGLGNLAILKAFVLPEAMAAQTTFDDRLAAIGAGVAAALESECNRRFGYLVDDTFEWRGDRSSLSLPRYPIASAGTIECQDTPGGAWSDVGATGEVALLLDRPAGIVDLGYALDARLILFRITFTGGYFFETLEPTDDGYPSALPAGATPLPADLQHAWLLQCQKIFERTRALSTSGVKSAEGQGQFIPSTKLDEGTVAMIAPYRRFA